MMRWDVDIPVTLFYTVSAETPEIAEMNAWADLLADLSKVYSWDTNGDISLAPHREEFSTKLDSPNDLDDLFN